MLFLFFTIAMKGQSFARREAITSVRNKDQHMQMTEEDAFTPMTLNFGFAAISK
jgi:hypothetical protein